MGVGVGSREGPARAGGKPEGRCRQVQLAVGVPGAGLRSTCLAGML